MDSSQLQRRLDSFAKFTDTIRREMYIPEAALGNDNTLWATMESVIEVFSHGYTLYQSEHYPIQIQELRIRELWYIFILSAKNIEADHPAQDRLTRIILHTKELGVLSRGAEGHVQDAIMSDGRLWIDLPFLLLDVQEAWRNIMSPSEPAAKRYNLAAAIARLAGVGLLDDVLSGCGMAVMSLALETPNDQDDSIEMALRLLPLVKIWLSYAGKKLLRLSVTNSPSNESAWYPTGDPTTGGLARDAEIETVGFNRDRFFFWKKRLSEIKWSDNKDVENVAIDCSMNIDQIWNSFFGWKDHVHTY